MYEPKPYKFFFASFICLSLIALFIAILVSSSDSLSSSEYSSSGCDEISSKTDFESTIAGSREVSDSLPTPKLDFWTGNVRKDGHHLMEAKVDNFKFAPERVNTDHRDGEGYLVWYLDGVKQGRVLSEWWWVDPLPAGEHSLVGILTSNDHKVYTKNGNPICAEHNLLRGENTDYLSYPVIASDPATSVTVKVISDGDGGWLLNAALNRWTLHPSHMTKKHVPGEGYMTLYVNGEHYRHMFSEWLELPYLSDGKNTVRVVLRANDGRILHSGGKPVMDEVTVVVDNDSGTIQVVRDGTGHVNGTGHVDNSSAHASTATATAADTNTDHSSDLTRQAHLDKFLTYRPSELQVFQ